MDVEFIKDDIRYEDFDSIEGLRVDGNDFDNDFLEDKVEFDNDEYEMISVDLPSIDKSKIILIEWYEPSYGFSEIDLSNFSDIIVEANSGDLVLDAEEIVED